MLAPNPQAGAIVWPIPGDVPDLLGIVTAQSETIEQQAVLIDAYQGNLNAVQNPPPGAPATSNGAITAGATTTIAVNGTVGTIVNGSIVGGTSNVTLPVVLGQISGTVGKDGTYLLNAAVTLAVVTSLTFTPPPPPSTWPIPQDAPTLDLIVQQQTAIIRVQTALIQHYQDLLNSSQVGAPATGP